MTKQSKSLSLCFCWNSICDVKKWCDKIGMVFKMWCEFLGGICVMFQKSGINLWLDFCGICDILGHFVCMLCQGVWSEGVEWQTKWVICVGCDFVWHFAMMRNVGCEKEFIFCLVKNVRGEGLTRSKVEVDWDCVTGVILVVCPVQTVSRHASGGTKGAWSHSHEPKWPAHFRLSLWKDLEGVRTLSFGHLFLRRSQYA